MFTNGKNMRLDADGQEYLSELLLELKPFWATDKQIADVLEITHTVLAKLKRGDDVSEAKWKTVVENLNKLPQQIAQRLGEQKREPVISPGIKKRIEILTDIDPTDHAANLGSTEFLRAKAARNAMLRLNDGSKVPWQNRAVIYTICNKFASPDTAMLVSAMEEHLSDLSILKRVCIPGDDPVSFRNACDWNVNRIMATFFLLPFYLTNDRRMTFGVIPFGVNKRIGLAIPKKWFQHFGRHKDPNELTVQDLELLLYHNDAKIHGVMPYSAQQVVFDAILEATPPEDRAENAFTVTSKSIVPGWRDFTDAGESIRELYKQDGSCQILAYTLRTKKQVETNLDMGEMVLCTLDTGIDTTVGVAFSLPAFDYLERDGKFASIRNSIRELCSRQEFRASLESDGILIENF